MAIKGITDIEHFPINEKSIEMKERSNAITGDKNYLYYRLKESFKNAIEIDNCIFIN